MTWAAIGALLVAVGGPMLWAAHAIQALRSDMHHLETHIGEDIRDLRAGVHADIRDLRDDVLSLRDEVVRDHGERIARLEERTRA